jgi:hypothetical protein
VNGSLLSDLEVARLERPTESDVDHVRRLARETVRELELVAPVDPALVASFRGITRIEEVDQPWAGCLTHEGNETVARIRARDNTRRKRFTTFHEVEHTYLPGFAVTQYRCDPAPANNRSEKASLERLADIGASELLFPLAQFTADLAGNRLDFDLVEDLAEVYEGSLGAAAIRAVTTSPRESLLICVEPAVKPTEPDAEAVPRILWSAGNGAWPFVPRHKSIPANSPIHRAMQGELVDEICDLAGITDPPIDHVDISCRLYPYVDHNGVDRARVLCLATRY